MQMKIPAYLSHPHWLASAEFWKINLDTLKKSSLVLFLKPKLIMKNKIKTTTIAPTTLNVSLLVKLTGTDIQQFTSASAIS